MKIYIGNLSKDMNDEQLKELVLPYGNPESAKVVLDRDGSSSRGFGFFELADATEAQAAIAGLNGKEVNGQVLKVNESQPKGGKTASA